jgi:hypothetical protein
MAISKETVVRVPDGSNLNLNNAFTKITDGYPNYQDPCISVS